MLAALDLEVGNGGMSARLGVSRSAAASTSRLLGLWALALVAPLLVLLASAALASATSHAGLNLLARVESNAPAALVILLVCPVVALVLLSAARVRVRVERSAGLWHGRVSMRLGVGELVAAILALLLVGLFVGHLVADGYACLNGMHSAC